MPKDTTELLDEIVNDLIAARGKPEEHGAILEALVVGIARVVETMADEVNRVQETTVQLIKEIETDRMRSRVTSNALAEVSIGMMGIEPFKQHMETILKETINGKDWVQIQEVDPEGEVNKIITKMKETP